MRSLNNNQNTTSSVGGVNGGLGFWKTPMPYLFGGLGVMLGLIAMALIVLACSYRKPSANSTGENGVIFKVEMEKKPSDVLVVMAGHQNPTCLAMVKPVSL